MQKRIIGIILLGIFFLIGIANAGIISLPRYNPDMNQRSSSGGRDKTTLFCAMKGMVDKPTDPCKICQGEKDGCCTSIACNTSESCYKYDAELVEGGICSNSCSDAYGTYYKNCTIKLSCDNSKINLLTLEEANSYTSKGYNCSSIRVVCKVDGFNIVQCSYSMGGGSLGGSIGSIGGIVSGSSQQSIDCYSCICPAGRYGENCLLCPKGSYNDQENAPNCTLCPLGYRINLGVTGATSLEEACIPCSTGSYIDLIGASSCKGCPAGYSSKTGVTGATSLDEACEICPEGTYKSNIGVGSCIPCPTGYVPISGVTGAVTMLQACAKPCVSCDGYDLLSCPPNAVCEECTPKNCEDSTTRYKVSYCEEGYSVTGNECVYSGAIKLVIDTNLGKKFEFNAYSSDYNDYDFTIDWGDGTQNTYNQKGFPSHTYAENKQYTLTITGNLPYMGSVTTKNVIELKQLDLNTVKEFYNTFTLHSQIKGTIPNLPPNLITAGGYESVFGTFYGCSGLTGDIPALPSGLTYGDRMFYGCSGLTGDIPALPSGLTYGDSMFYGCSGLTGKIPELPGSLKDGGGMFDGCSGLTGDIPALPSGLTDGGSMFYGCSGLTGSIPPLPGSLKDGGGMFSGCTGLNGQMVTNIPSSLEDGNRMFDDCSGLTGKIPTFPENSKLTDGGSMFRGCESLTGGIPKLPESLTDGSGMFSGCAGLNGSITNIPSNLEDGGSMFSLCEGLTGTIPALPNTLTDGALMFLGCEGLEGFIPTLPSNLIDGYSMFEGCEKLTGGIPKLPESLKNGHSMFSGCTSLDGQMVTSIPANLEDGGQMFSLCANLQGNIPTFPKNSKLTNGSLMFHGCYNLKGEVPPLPSGLTEALNMFRGCSITGTTPIKPSSLDCSVVVMTILDNEVKACDSTFKGTQVTNDGSWPDSSWNSWY